MKIPAVKQLIERYNVEELMAAEEALLEEKPLEILVEGDDEGEQLTHILAAIFILNDMKDSGGDFRTSLRKYSQRVRNSIN